MSIPSGMYGRLPHAARRPILRAPHVDRRCRLLPGVGCGADHRAGRRRPCRAAVAQAPRAAGVPRAQPTARPHARAPGWPALERPRREAGASLPQRSAARVPARARGRWRRGRRGPGAARRRRVAAGLRRVRRATRPGGLDRRGGAGGRRVPRRARRTGHQRVRGLAHRGAWAVARPVSGRPRSGRRGAGGAGRPGARGSAGPAGAGGWPGCGDGGEGGAGGKRGQVVLVEGEPGLGKTRLIEEIDARARLADATAARARAVPADEERSWSGIRGLLAGGLGEAPGLAAASAGALAALGTLDPDVGTRFPAQAASPPLPVAEAWSAAVRAAAAERPVLLALDDAQFLDAETAAALPGVARDLAGHALALVLGR